MTEKFNVGYIGLGSIGKPIAKHLVCDQFNAHVYDIHRPAVAELAALGARGCDSLAQLARDCAHIGICVLEASQVEAVLYGADGLLENAASGAIIAIHSTVTRADVLKWAGAGAARGIRVIDAPITGGVRSAEAASLCYMVGGDSATFATASRVFETSAEKIIHTGELGTGILLKLCNNLITNAEFMAMSEATRLAEAGGLSAELLREVGKSNGVINETMYNFINNRNALAATCSAARMEEIFGPPGKLGEKDLLCAIQSARELGVELPYTQRLQGDIYNLFLNKV